MAGVFAFLAFRVGGAPLRKGAQVANEQTGTGQVADTTQTGAAQVAADAARTTEADSEGDDFDKDRALRTIRTLREEAKAAKAAAKELETAKARLAELEGAQLSEQQRLEKERDDARKERDALRETMRVRDIRSQATVAATKAGAVDPEIIARLLDPSEVETDEDGSAKNLTSLLNRLKSDHPILFRPAQGSADGGARGAAGAVDPGTGVSRLRYAYDQSPTAARR